MGHVCIEFLDEPTDVAGPLVLDGPREQRHRVDGPGLKEHLRRRARVQ